MKGLERNDPERARRYFEDRLSFTTGPAGLASAMKDGTVNVVDVRAAKDFEREHIAGSVNLPERDWPTERGLARDRVNVVLCYSEVCYLAARAAVEWATRGYSVMELQGGFAAWKAEHLPIESGGAVAEDPLGRARALLDERRSAEHDALKAEKPEARAVEHGGSQPEKVESAPSEPATSESTKSETRSSEATKDQPATPDQANPEAAESRPAKTESAQQVPH